MIKDEEKKRDKYNTKLSELGEDRAFYQKTLEKLSSQSENSNANRSSKITDFIAKHGGKKGIRILSSIALKSGNTTSLKNSIEKQSNRVDSLILKKSAKLNHHLELFSAAKIAKGKSEKILENVENAIKKKKSELESGTPLQVKTLVDENKAEIKIKEEELKAENLDVETLTKEMESIEKDLEKDLEDLKK
jgi:hypothetical protein